VRVRVCARICVCARARVSVRVCVRARECARVHVRAGVRACVSVRVRACVCVKPEVMGRHTRLITSHMDFVHDFIQIINLLY